ncbi:MAG: DUF1684 domain-containing protein [Actinomycetota bacterium]
MDTTALLEQRAAKDEFFQHSTQSPVPAGERASFNGLSYYDPSPDLAFTVPVDVVESEPIQIGTTTGEERTYHRVATATVAVEGTDVTVGLYSTGHPGLFLPFRDATSGNDTYGAGRYLDVEPNGDGTVTIDFNYAYAPFCAYSEAYSCALPPFENWLDVPIRAGERNPTG